MASIGFPQGWGNEGSGVRGFVCLACVSGRLGTWHGALCRRVCMTDIVSGLLYESGVQCCYRNSICSTENQTPCQCEPTQHRSKCASQVWSRRQTPRQPTTTLLSIRANSRSSEAQGSVLAMRHADVHSQLKHCIVFFSCISSPTTVRHLAECPAASACCGTA